MKRLLPKSEFGRNVLTLMTGASIAQAIPIVISPILSRIYTPKDFGVFALYMAIVLIAGTIATGRYELAITLPLEEEDAKNLVFLALIISVSVSVVLMMITLVFNVQITSLLGNPEIGFWLYFIPVSVLLSGIYQSLNYWLIRQKHYKELALRNVLQGSATAAGQVAIGTSIAGSSGLFFGSILGQIVAVISLIKATKKSSLTTLHSKILLGIKKQAHRYKRFPMLQGPSTIIEASSSQLPVVILGIFFGPVTVGLFSLSQKLVSIPTRIVGSSIGDVFRQRASKDFTRCGDSTEIFIATLKKLILISTPFFLIFFFFAQDLFSLIFGAKWRVAGEYAQIMTPLFWLSFIVSPLSVMFTIAEKQNLDLLIQILLITCSIAALTLGHYIFPSAKYSIAAFTLVYTVKYSFELYFSYKFCKKSSFVLS